MNTPVPAPVRVDAHQHFWAYSAEDYPWIPQGSALHRDWLPSDLAAVQAPLGFSGSIAVQARQTLLESRWLLALAEASPRILGVVGWVDLRAPAVEEDLAALAQHPKFVGVRHVVQDEPDPRFLLRPDFQRGIGKLGPFGLRYDLLVYPEQLPAAIELVHRFPDQPFVLDHAGKPRIKDRLLSPWREAIRELATAPNVWCKVSGLVTEADHNSSEPADFTPYLETIFAAFGPERLLFGSDWPVCLLAARYEQVWRLVDEFTRSLSETARAGLFGANAVRCYDLGAACAPGSPA